MTQSTLDLIMDRISVATNESPIAVFKVNGKLDALFASTAETKQLLSTKPSNLVGVFYNTMNPLTVKNKCLL